jgi:hypothetical protein
MRNRQLFFLALAAVGVCIVLGVYYLIPGIYHPLTFSGSPTASHLKHALVFFGLAVLALIASRFAIGSQPSGR